MHIRMKRLLQAIASFILGALTLYLGGLFTVAVLKTVAAAGLLTSLIVGPILVAVILWRTASAQTRLEKTSGYTLAAGFASGFVCAAFVWLYMVCSVLTPLANMS